MTYETTLYLENDIAIEVEFQADVHAYRPATMEEPEEGGIDCIYDVVITGTDDDCEYGPSLKGMKLTPIPGLSCKQFAEMAETVENWSEY